MPPALPVPLMPGGGIEILELIGRGGMGTVWKGRDRRRERFVAVKFLDAPEGDRTARLRFEREARSLARLDHPGIVSVFDFVCEGDSCSIVMEFVDGRPLSELLPVDSERALALTIRIAEAVAHAHAKGIVHRDLKPANVLVAEDGRVKIADFGIARAVVPDPSTDSKLTRTGEFLGTPRYMAPEVLDGAAPDPRIDVYSIGVLLREMIEPTRPGQPRSPLPAVIDRVVARATAVDARGRYSDAGAMLPDLWRAAGTFAGDLPPGEEKWPRGVAFLATVAFVAVVSAVAGLTTRRFGFPGRSGFFAGVGLDRLSPVWLAGTGLLAGLASWAAEGVLARRWRKLELDRPHPSRRVDQASGVLWFGIVSALVGVIPAALGWRGPSVALSGLGAAWALLAAATLYQAWLARLEAGRTSRPLSREPKVWLGIGFVVAPLAVDLASAIARVPK